MVETPDAARDLLGVDPRSTASEIRRAYRRLARIHHPDAGGDADTFLQLRAAVDLLLERSADRPETPASPSTGRRAYPSTSGRFRSAGGAVVDDRDVDTSVLDDRPLPSPASAWSRDDLARAVAAWLRGGDAVPLVGVSRRPGSWLNRFSRHLSEDLLSRWRIEPATRRGVAGHDLEAVVRLPSGARKRLDRATTPPGWSTVRRPSSTESTLVIHPGPTEAATAVLAALAVDELCEAIGWPLSDWRLPA